MQYAEWCREHTRRKPYYGQQNVQCENQWQISSLEDIANTVVSNSGGKIILLKDVATVDFRNEQEKHITRLNGRRCMPVNAAQKVGSNIGSTQEKYIPIIQEFERALLPNIKPYKHFD